MTDERKQKLRENAKKWNAANPDRVRENVQKWQAANPEKVREYRRKRYAKNSEKIRASNRKWREANPEKVKEYKNQQKEKNRESCAKWRNENREKARNAVRNWYAEHPEKQLQHDSRRRARQHGVVVTQVDLEFVWNRDKGICYLCGKAIDRKDCHFDHVIPLAKGGPHTTDNLRPTHSKCNTKKRDTIIDLAQVKKWIQGKLL